MPVPAAQDSEELHMEETLAEEDLGPAEALGGAGADSDGWSQLTAGPVQPTGSITHLCPCQPIATGLGP